MSSPGKNGDDRGQILVIPDQFQGRIMTRSQFEASQDSGKEKSVAGDMKTYLPTVGERRSKKRKLDFDVL